MSVTWEHLRQLRANGQRPVHRLIVTNDPRFAYGFENLGAMCIVQRAGESMPVELLEGLDVLLWLKSCDQAAAVLRLCKARNVHLASLRTLCRCYGTLEHACSPCQDTHAINQWLDSLPSQVTVQ